MIQEIIVFLLVVLSLLYLSKVTWIKFFKKENSCDSCAMGKRFNQSSNEI
jgi:hypothetical protein